MLTNNKDDWNLRRLESLDELLSVDSIGIICHHVAVGHFLDLDTIEVEVGQMGDTIDCDNLLGTGAVGKIWNNGILRSLYEWPGLINHISLDWMRGNRRRVLKNCRF